MTSVVVLTAEMAARLHNEIRNAEDDGCRLCSFGAVKVPDGFAVLLNADQSHFFGLKWDGTESEIHWNRWAVYRWCIKAAALNLIEEK